MPDYFNQFLDKVVASIPNLLTAILIFVGSLYVAKLLSNLLKSVLERREADREVTLLLATITFMVREKIASPAFGLSGSPPFRPFLICATTDAGRSSQMA